MMLQIGGRPIVIDCGLGVTRGLVDAGIALKDLDLVLITHLHSDHVLELGPLIHTAWTAGLNRTVRVFAPRGTKALWDGFVTSMSYDIDLRIADEGRPDIRKLVSLTEYSQGAVLSGDGLEITALRVDHPPVAECFALKVECRDKTIVFSSDTACFPPLAQFARGAGILVHEAMLSGGVDRLVARTGNAERLKAHLLASHTLAEDAGRIASQAGVGHLVINHLIPGDDPEFTRQDWINAVRSTWEGPLTIARDGLVIGLQSPVNARKRA
jgi:ribonuclease BN (tRNA processing enzyme)